MAAGFEGLYKSLQKIQSSLLLNSDGRKLKEKWLAKSNNFVQVLIYHSLNILLKSFPNIFRICRQFQNPFSRLKRLFCLCNSFTCLHNGCCRQFSTDFTLFPDKTIPKQSSQDHLNLFFVAYILIIDLYVMLLFPMQKALSPTAINVNTFVEGPFNDTTTSLHHF